MDEWKDACYQVKEPLDPRSTWRKRLRRVLLTTGRPYLCEVCGRTSKHDGDKVDGVVVYVPDEARFYIGIGALQANHRNKELSDIDPANGEWLCASCHKTVDQQTDKGVSLYGDEYGYSMPPPVGNDE